jgi:hypothetical protein
MHCHAGCNYTDILAKLGMTDRDLFDEDKVLDVFNPVQTYVYQNGRKNHRKLKENGKKGFWSEGTSDHSLYAVERIGDAQTVFLCEGEKGANFLWAMGKTAVATGGSERTCDLEPLKGRIVIIIADRDKSGYDWAQRHYVALLSSATMVCVMQAKVNIPKADIVEHITAGYTLEELEPVVFDTPAAVTNGQAPKPMRRIEWKTGDQIEDAVPVWAWSYSGKGRIQLGTLALFAGRPGAGKSSAARWFAAQATLGALDGCWWNQPQQVAYIATAEESAKYTIMPGLRAAGANISMVHFPSVFNGDEAAQLLSVVDEVALIEYLLVRGVTVVIVDPLMSTIAGTSDVNKNNEVRSQIQPWARIADQINGVVLGVAHLRKNNTGDVVAGVTGSSAFGEVARAVFGFAKNTNDDTRVMSQHKNSTGYEDLSLSYEIVSEPVTVSTGETTDIGSFRITGDSEITVEDILTDGLDNTGTGADCKRWLYDYLSVEQPCKSKDVKDAAHKQGSWSARTVERAAKKLKVVSRSQDFPRITYWSLPDATGGTDATDATAVTPQW